MSARRPLALVLTAAAEHVPASAHRNGHAESKINVSVFCSRIRANRPPAIVEVLGIDAIGRHQIENRLPAANNSTSDMGKCQRRDSPRSVPAAAVVFERD
jgi:hypothetical protein